ncbi:ATP-binding protein [Tautonia marina]|uniref:ATP-binding protein n=1 Tax=Tautonia marina TaxID=2653855 RepID=UPI001260BB36|nr:ATP-binding protein [Tautonia marina]
MKYPEQVFTPRSANVNEIMYVDRPFLENALESSLRGSLHTIIHGESGTGKSWLYKSVMSKLAYVYFPANLANASRMGSITNEISNIIATLDPFRKVAYRESKAATLSVPGVEGGLGHDAEYQLAEIDPLERCFALARRKANDSDAFVVLDNLESVFDDKSLMKELANVITLLDDERYSRYRVKLLIVGVPSGVKEYFASTPNMHTISNRLYELPEVSRLSYDQASALIVRGLIGELKFRASSSQDLDQLVHYISWVTDRVPQRIHEYCLELSRIIAKNGNVINLDLLEEADRQWVSSSLSHDYSVIESLMNNKDTRVGRRNQVLFSLGKMDGDEIKLQDIEDIVRREFPSSTCGTKLNISGMLSELAGGEKAVIKRSAKGDSYVFKDPKFRMCIRVMLLKENDETVKKIDLSKLTG